MSRLNNDFNRDELRRWFTYNFDCWWCGANHADCFHHIAGRLGEHTSSILNAAPLSNFYCHLNIHGKIRRPENQRKFLAKTIKYLLKQGYVLNEKDRRFIAKNRKHYEAIAADDN